MSSDFRAKQAIELAGVIKTASQSLPVIAVGDWNSEATDIGDGAQLLLTLGGLRDAWNPLRGSGLPYGHDETLMLIPSVV